MDQYQDIGMISNKKYNLETYKGYNTAILKDRFRAINILKNRDGEADKVIGVKFLGEIGLFEELKPPTILTDLDYNLILKN